MSHICSCVSELMVCVYVCCVCVCVLVFSALPVNPLCTQACKRTGTLQSNFCPNDFGEALSLSQPLFTYPTFHPSPPFSTVTYLSLSLMTLVFQSFSFSHPLSHHFSTAQLDLFSRFAIAAEPLSLREETEGTLHGQWQSAHSQKMVSPNNGEPSVRTY